MIHGPCGKPCDRGHLGCCKNSPDAKYSKIYPKAFSPITDISVETYSDYRRRSREDGGNVAEKHYRKKPVTIDNSWVVPYSPYFLLNRFKRHINMKFVSSISSIKYLFLYHFKGEDLVTVEGLNEDVEISMYATRRNISACQTYWRIADFQVIRIVPSIKQLPIHLPGEQPVRYEPSQRGVMDAITQNTVTPLISYFNTNCCPIIGERARTVKYKDFPTYFVWKSDTKLGTLHKNQPSRGKRKAIGRIVAVHQTARAPSTFPYY